MRRAAEEWAVFLLALQFLTRLPVRVDWSEARMARSPSWYPAVGIVIGAIAAAIYALAALALPASVAAVLAIAGAVLLTGALHEDGFADLCDGLGGGNTVERALEIMRDSRTGAYGAIGLVLLIALKLTTLAAMSPSVAPVALIGAHGISRLSLTQTIATGTYLRESGAGRAVAGTPIGLVLPWITAALSILPLAVLAGPLTALGAAAGAAAGHVLVRRLCERRLGGYTGDCLGGGQQTAETGAYLGVLAVL